MTNLTIDQLRTAISQERWILTSDGEIQGAELTDDGDPSSLTGTIYAAMSKGEISIVKIEDWSWSVARGLNSWPIRTELEGAVLVDDDGDELEAGEASYELDKAIGELAADLLVPNYDRFIPQTVGGN